jgi:hypothetical protein
LPASAHPIASGGFLTPQQTGFRNHTGGLLDAPAMFSARLPARASRAIKNGVLLHPE